MAQAGRTIHLDLSPDETRILIQALQHCLATCHTRAQKPDAPCEDCDAARELRKRIEALAS